VLFRLPEYDECARSFAFEAVSAIARERSPLLAQIPSAPVPHVRASRMTGESGEATSLEPAVLRAELEMDIRPIVDGDLGEVGAALERVAEQEVQSFTAAFVERMDKITEAAGTSVDAGGRPLSHDLLLEMFERIDIDFDDEGNAELALFAPSNLIRKLQELPAITDEQQRAWDEMMARKRADFEARTRRRRLG
jgi:hypothetical protein